MNQPTAHICFNKSRKKVYDNKLVYLKDGQEFSLELFNPTTDEVLAKISLNGTQFDRGIIIMPGQRIFLERFLDNPNKFKFETYDVSGSNQQVKQAIVNNGLVSVEFFEKQKPLNFSITTSGSSWNTGGYTGIRTPYTYTGVGGNQFYCSTTPSLDGLSGSVTTNCSNTVDLTGNANITFGSGTTFTTASGGPITYRTTTDGAQIKPTVEGDQLPINTPTPTKSVETGRVTEGAASSQELKDDTRNLSWSYMAMITYDYQIMPESTKAIEAKEIKSFCTGCGASAKKEWKFCSSCGNKI